MNSSSSRTLGHQNPRQLHLHKFGSNVDTWLRLSKCVQHTPASRTSNRGKVSRFRMFKTIMETMRQVSMMMMMIVACHGCHGRPKFAVKASILNQISIKIWENSNLTEKRKFLVLILTYEYQREYSLYTVMSTALFWQKKPKFFRFDFDFWVPLCFDKLFS